MPQIAFVREEMASATLTFLTDTLWKDHLFSDIDLDFGGEIFHVHRLLLCQSPFLERFLGRTPYTQKTLQLTISDRNVTSGALRVCLSTLYGLEPVLDEDNIISVLATAFLLELDALCDVCISFLPNLVTPTLFLSLHAFNDTWDGKEYSIMIADVLERYLCRTAFFELRASLHKLPRGHLVSLFPSNALWVPTEAERFQLVIDVYFAMKRAYSDEDCESIPDPLPRSDSKRLISRRSTGYLTRESLLASHDFGRSASFERTLHLDKSNTLDINRVHSVPTQRSAHDLNHCKYTLSAMDCEFLESVLADDKIHYSSFSFADLVRAKRWAQNLGLKKIVRCIENSLWQKSTTETIIISEASKNGDLRASRSLDQDGNADVIGMMSQTPDHSSPCFRYSTEIKDVEAFRRTRDFASEQFYFCGSLFRVVLTIRFDETSQNHFIGMYLQRTMMSSLDSWQFCDPRSHVNVHVEFIAGTRVLEMIELEGRLEAPHNNKGYSRFLYDSELPKYLSPSGSLRITAILRLIFDSAEAVKEESR